MKKLDQGEGDAFFKIRRTSIPRDVRAEGMKADESNRHFGLMVRDEKQIAEVRAKLTKKYGIKLIRGFRCDFRDPWDNRNQVVDLHDESLVWLLPYQEVQETGVRFE